MSTSWFRRSVAGLVISILSVTFAGCPAKSGSASATSNSGKLDGVYHAASGGPITITIKSGKATVQIAGESKILDYKVEGSQLRIIDPKEGDVSFTINDDGTLTGQLGLMSKKTP